MHDIKKTSEDLADRLIKAILVSGFDNDANVELVLEAHRELITSTITSYIDNIGHDIWNKAIVDAEEVVQRARSGDYDSDFRSIASRIRRLSRDEENNTEELD